MKVYTKNSERTVAEMNELWRWMTDNFGAPSSHNRNLSRWTYGKDHPGFMGSEMIDGTWDIEWFDFRDEKDVTAYLLRWA